MNLTRRSLTFTSDSATTSSNKHTAEQDQIVDLARSSSTNIMIEALAGTGKSYELKLLYDALGRDTTYLVFNTANAKEALAERDWNAMTFNSCGARAWNAAQGKANLNAYKVNDLFKNFINQAKSSAKDDLWDAYFDVVSGVAMAKAIGYVPHGTDPYVRSLATQEDLISRLDGKIGEFTLGLIDQTLRASIQTAFAGAFDFNDQIYMPTLYGVSFNRNPNLFVDEWQDLNPINLAMLDKIIGERIIGVGDPNQGIYRFRGAQADAMPYGIRHWNMTTASLSVSFRCPEAIVKNARWKAPHYQWHKPGGSVTRAKELGKIPDKSAIICRNNAPLFRLAFQLLSEGRSVKVWGSEIGPRIINIMRRFGDDTLPRSSVRFAIDEWYIRELEKESKTCGDIAECMKVFCSQGRDLGEIIKYAQAVMKSEGTIQLLTGHKAKGLEFPLVYFIEPQLIRQDEEQDLNLKYVIQTRSSDVLVEVEPQE